jgi:hypothetical protein
MRPDLLSRQEAAKILRCSVAVVDHLMRVGLLDRVLLSGRYVRVPRRQVEYLRGCDPVTLLHA